MVYQLLRTNEERDDVIKDELCIRLDKISEGFFPRDIKVLSGTSTLKLELLHRGVATARVIKETVMPKNSSTSPAAKFSHQLHFLQTD